MGHCSFGPDRPGSVYAVQPGLRVRPSHPGRTGHRAASEPVWFDGAPMLKTEGKGRDDLDEWLRTSETAQKVLNSPRALAESAAARQGGAKTEQHAPSTMQKRPVGTQAG